MLRLLKYNQVNIADLTKEQREAIQPGEPTAPAQAGQATLYVYELDKGKCPLGDTLPNTGHLRQQF